MLTEFGHGTGAIKDTEDKRDFLYSNIAGYSPFDWSIGFDIGVELPIKNQGTSFSCGGQAWANYVQAINKGDERSAKFIYSQTFVPGGGSAGRENCALVIKNGSAKESILTSYENGKPPSEEFMEKKEITEAITIDAILPQKLSYVSVNTDFETLVCAIRDHKGIVIGLTGENNGTWLSTFPIPPKKGTWNHWVYAGKAKIINGKKHIGILNSWGDIGEKGWQWLSEDYAPWIFSAWALIPGLINKHIFYIPLKYGDTGSEVLALQRCLVSLGYPCLPNGIYDSTTAAEVFEFQKKYAITSVWSFISVWSYMGRRVGTYTIPALNKIFA